MSFTVDLYKAIAEDMQKGSVNGAPFASRLIRCGNGALVIYAINMITGMKAAYFAVGTAAPKNVFPSWKGIEIGLARFPAYSVNQEYVGLTQIPQCAEYIFEIVVEDIRASVDAAASADDALAVIVSVLAKWREFFQAEHDVLLSEERQQGLYGELLFLKESINVLGTTAVAHWAGSDADPHDFYIASDAVEVKTSCKAAPYSAHISNEYQLDTHDIPGGIYLRFYALRRSRSSGETLPSIVAHVREMLADDPSKLALFNAKLQKYGYFDEVADSYGIGYYIRDAYTFAVQDAFPRITKDSLMPGVSNTVYAISIAQCVPYAISADELYAVLKGV